MTRNQSILSCSHLLALFMAVASVLSAQTTYYLSENGDDNNTGESASQAWATIDRLNQQSLSAGDSVLFEQGGVFRGQIDWNQSGSASNPIVLSSYNGDPQLSRRPVISGAVVVEFLNAGSNIWTASLDQKPVALYSSEYRFVPAREPNTDFITSTGGSKTTLTSDDLNSGVNYAGRSVRLRSSNWTFEAREITSSSGNTISWADNIQYDMGNGWGFFLEGHPDYLDAEGEFYYDENAKELRVYSSQNPGAVEALVYDYGMTTPWNIGAFRVEGIQFDKQAVTAINMKGTAGNIQISNCVFSQQEEHGMNFGGTYNDVLVQNNEFLDMAGSGIMAQNISNSEIANNTFKRVGMFQGYGAVWGFPINNNSGIGIAGSNLHVHSNDLDSIGYAGIRVDGDYNLIEENVIYHSLMTQNDGGALYAWGEKTHHSVFRNNVAKFIYGNTKGSPYDGMVGAALYLDNKCHNMLVQNNILMHSNALGIQLNSETRVDTVENNFIYGFESAAIGIYEDATGITNENNVIRNNVMVAWEPEQIFIHKQTTANTDNFQPGTFANNEYHNLVGVPLFKSSKIGGDDVHQYLGMGAWEDLVGESGSSVIKHTWQPWDVNATGSELVANGSFDSGTNGWSKWTNGTASLNYLSSSPLDGGALQLVNSSSDPNALAFATHGLDGDWTNGQWYRISYDVISSQNGLMTVVPKRNESPYTGMSGTSMREPLSTERRRVVRFFQSNENISAPRIDFEVRASSGDYTIDHVSIQEVGVSAKDIADTIFAATNASASTAAVSLPAGLWEDGSGAEYCGSITLDAWGAELLFRQDGEVCLPVSGGQEKFMPMTQNWNQQVRVSGSEVQFLANRPFIGLEIFSLKGQKIYGRQFGKTRSVAVQRELLPAGSYVARWKTQSGAVQRAFAVMD